MNLLQEITNYQPFNLQEAHDKECIIDFITNHADCLERKNQTAHITTSIWTINKDCTKTLMVYHNIYDSWSCIGGHADGN